MSTQTLGERIRALREGRSLSQFELATIIGVAPAVVSHYETGKLTPSLGTFRWLCAALKCDATILLGTENLPDLASCPYCHGAMEVASEETCEGRYPMIYWAECSHCGSRGPIVGYAADAMFLARCRGNAMDIIRRLEDEEDEK